MNEVLTAAIGSSISGIDVLEVDKEDSIILEVGISNGNNVYAI